ncbi:MAG: hypothetical protein K5654_01140 [Lachnospiraceae bacterium]|nr:hypothetical protein [Lachnospiraceae bacterium]
MEKLKSRKFWICVAAALASLGTSVAGIASSNEVIAGVGLACTVISTAIYAFCEAWVDASSASATTTSKVTTTTTVTQKEVPK